MSRPGRPGRGSWQPLDPDTTLLIVSEGVHYPDLPTRTGAGQGLVLRRPAAQAPAPDEPDAALLGAALELGVTDLVVYGHLACPELRAALEAGRSRCPALQHALELLQRFYGPRDLDARARLEVLAQENSLVQLEALRVIPRIRQGEALGRLRLHAWVHEPGLGLWGYDPQQEQFVRAPAPWPRRARANAAAWQLS